MRLQPDSALLVVSLPSSHDHQSCHSVLSPQLLSPTNNAIVATHNGRSADECSGDNTMALVSHGLFSGQSGSANTTAPVPAGNSTGSSTSSSSTPPHTVVNSNAILTPKPSFCTNSAVNAHEFQPDRPIGYGAFGVVWYVLSLIHFRIVYTQLFPCHMFLSRTNSCLVAACTHVHRSLARRLLHTARARVNVVMCSCIVAFTRIFPPTLVRAPGCASPRQCKAPPSQLSPYSARSCVCNERRRETDTTDRPSSRYTLFVLQAIIVTVARLHVAAAGLPARAHGTVHRCTQCTSAVARAHKATMEQRRPMRRHCMSIIGTQGAACTLFIVAAWTAPIECHRKRTRVRSSAGVIGHLAAYCNI